MDDYTRKSLERFWSKVDLSKVDEEFACWEWTATKVHDYGQISWQGRGRYTHRLAYELAYGKYPAELDVCHHCDNRSCCNPNHLFLGTNADNTRDRDQKGRQVSKRGEQHVLHKLTDAQVVEIRQRYARGGISQPALAREFGVVQAQIWNIVHRKSRRSV